MVYDKGVLHSRTADIWAQKDGFPAIDRRVFVIVHAKRMPKTTPPRERRPTGKLPTQDNEKRATRHDANPSEGTCSGLVRVQTIQ
jgi:hypothetical protein